MLDPEAIPSVVREVCKVIEAAGHQAVCVGGAVRDLILQGQPDDWDVASSAMPEEISKLFPNVIPTGIQHGTVSVVHKGMVIEVTTYRGEGTYTDGRRPDSVTLGVPLREDLARRDFTINAIALRPSDMSLHDPFNGMADIKAKTIRAVGDAKERFKEDGLRIFRAIRFSSKLGFSIERKTLEAVASEREMLRLVAWERIFVELTKTLNGQCPEKALDVARESGVLSYLFPDRQECSFQLVGNVPVGDSRFVMFSHLMFGASLAKTSSLFKLKLPNKLASKVGRILPRLQELPKNAMETRQVLSQMKREDHESYFHCLAQLNPEIHSTAYSQKDNPLWISDLVVDGRQIAKWYPTLTGRNLGEALKFLVDEVVKDPSINNEAAIKEKLLKFSQTVQR